MKYKSTSCKNEDTLFLSPVNSFGRLILVSFVAVSSRFWGPVFEVSTSKICAGDLGNSCFCDWDDDASALLVLGRGTILQFRFLLIWFWFLLLLKRIQVLANSSLWFCLGDTQHFFAHSIVISVLFNDTLCLSLSGGTLPKHPSMCVIMPLRVLVLQGVYSDVV